MRRNDYIFGVILLVLGGYYLLRNLGLIRIDTAIFWPLVLIVLGGLILYKGGNFKRRR